MNKQDTIKIHRALAQKMLADEPDEFQDKISEEIGKYKEKQQKQLEVAAAESSEMTIPSPTPEEHQR